MPQHIRCLLFDRQRGFLNIAGSAMLRLDSRRFFLGIGAEHILERLAEVRRVLGASADRPLGKDIAEALPFGEPGDVRVAFHPRPTRFPKLFAERPFDQVELPLDLACRPFLHGHGNPSSGMVFRQVRTGAPEWNSPDSRRIRRRPDYGNPPRGQPVGSLPAELYGISG